MTKLLQYLLQLIQRQFMLEETPTSQSDPLDAHQQALNLALQETCDGNTNKINVIQGLRNTQGEQFEFYLKQVCQYFVQGDFQFFLAETQVMRKIMAYFVKLSNHLEGEHSAYYEGKMLFILSLIAELLKQNPKLYFPFTRRFMLRVFTIDDDLLEGSPQKNQILAILGVIYDNIAKQGRLIHKLKIDKELKRAVLGNYHLISDIYSLKLMNRVILEMAARGIKFTSGEFHKHRILETMANFISKSQIDLLSTKINGLFPKKMENSEMAREVGRMEVC